jgi:hypothetical protein
MTIIVTHSKVSTIPDGDDTSVVRPSDWNDDHVLVGLGTAAELDAGVPNGVATLDATGKVPTSELPASIIGALNYQGTWNASTNTPTLTSSVGTKGYYYVVNVAGNTDLNGITDWQVGDWAVYNGTVWQKVDNTDAGGDVVGPSSATDNAIARFDTTTGKLIQNSVVTIGDTGAATGFTTLSASTSVTTPIVQASNSGGLALKNSGGTTQMSVGAGGGDNMSINVSTNLNGTNAQIDISPTGTGHVHMKPSGTGSIEIAPTNVGTMDNMTIGATTPKAITGTTVTATSFVGSGASLTNVVNSAVAGTGISVSGATGAVTITNTAPDQTVSLTAGTGISTSGTYPNFTITNTAPSSGGTVTSVGLSAPAMFTVSGSPVTGSGTLALTYSGTALPLANGGTGATSAPAAMANLMGFTTTVTSATPVVLTNTSSYYQVFTGSTAQTVTLPVTSTLALGWSFHICNNSSAVITVNSSGGNLVLAIPVGTTVMYTCILTSGTTAASWEAGLTDFSTSTGTGAVVLATSPTLVTPDLGTPSGGVVTNLTGTASININGTVGATTPAAGTFTTATANRFIPNSATVPTNGMYLPAANSLGFATNSAAKMTLDATGNLGLGVTPAAFGGGRWLQFLSTSLVGQQQNGTANLICNAYESSANTFTYIASVAAARYNAGVGVHSWHTAPAGTAGNAVTFTQAMTLFNTGGLSLGNTTDPGATNLSVTGTITSAAHTANSFIPSSSTVPTNGMYLPAANAVGIATNSTNAVYVNSTQQVGIGNSSPANKLDVASAVSATPVTNGIVRIVGTGANPATGSGGGLLFAQQNSAGTYQNYASIAGSRSNNAANDKVDLCFATGSPTDAIAVAERMRIFTTGGVSIGNTTDKGAASLNVSGLIFPQQAATASAPAYVKGAIYFDTTLNKLRVGGATAWETITSV